LDISGEQQIDAPRERVWEALNDPEILRQCITGCESLERISDDEMKAEVVAKFGPVKAKFKAKISIEDQLPPNSCRLVGEGQGGVAGFAKGAALINLQESDGGTLLTYEADMQVGGKIAQIGSRLVSGTTNKLVGEFFEKFPTLL
jgi:carbon monoxide dehydrogenase subunit G